MGGGRENNRIRTHGAPDQPDDAVLARDALTDPEAFAALYDRYVELVYRYSYRKLGNVASAEDATSITFFNALKGLRSFDPETKPFRSWLFGIAHNAIVDQVRGLQRRRESDFDLAFGMTDRNPQPDDEVIALDESKRLRQAVDTLPGEQERVMNLRLAGLSGPEIATSLGRNPGAIRATQHRAIHRLRTLLNPGTQAAPEADGDRDD